MLKFYSLDSFAKNYKNIPKVDHKVVLLFKLDNELNIDTLKSILDQSLSVHDIAIHTDKPKFFKEYKHIISVHIPGTEHVREGDKETQIIEIVNGKIYAFDFLETLGLEKEEKEEKEKSTNQKLKKNQQAMRASFENFIVNLN